jgi:fibronectin type 3 domain-containing protein
VALAGPLCASLTWTDVATNESGYILNRNGWASPVTLAANTSSYVDSSVVTGNSYTYTLVATNPLGNSTPTRSATVSFSGVALPAAPTNLTGVAQTGPQILLNWTDNATNETSYVFTRTGNVGGTVTIPLAANTTTYTDTAVVAGGIYTYSLVAVNAAGNSTPAATVTVMIAPRTPTSLQFTRITTSSLSISWQDNQTTPAESGYEVWYSLNGTTWTLAGTVGPNVTTFNHTGLITRTRYYYRVRAFITNNPMNYSAWSTSINRTTN